MRSPRLTTTAGRGAALAVLAVTLLTGCGGGTPEAGSTPGTATGTATMGTTAHATSLPIGESKSPQDGSDPTSDKILPLDWLPEEPAVLATGLKMPDDYEPATLNHPARNVPKPVMPAEAKEETEAGAQAFLNYRADAQWYSMQTGDTSLIREITSPDCEKCAEQYDYFDAVFAGGNWGRGGFETEKIIKGSFHRRPDGGYNLPVEVDSKGMAVIEDSEIRRRQQPFIFDDRFDAYLYREAGEWRYLTASPRGSL